MLILHARSGTRSVLDSWQFTLGRIKRQDGAWLSRRSQTIICGSRPDQEEGGGAGPSREPRGDQEQGGGAGLRKLDKSAVILFVSGAPYTDNNYYLKKKINNSHSVRKLIVGRFRTDVETVVEMSCTIERQVQPVISLLEKRVEVIQPNEVVWGIGVVQQVGYQPCLQLCPVGVEVGWRCTFHPLHDKSHPSPAEVAVYLVAWQN